MGRAKTVPGGIDTSALRRDLRALRNEGWPDEIAKTFARIARYSQEAAVQKARHEFDFHTDWIPRGIMAIPVTPSQEAAAARALKTKGDMLAAVYLRGAADPKRSLEFMVDHETGKKRQPHGGNKSIAVMDPALEKKTRSGRGARKPGWLPGKLLDVFRKAQSEFRNGTTLTKSFGWRRGPGKAKIPGNYFIIQTRRGVPMIVRRKAREGMKKRGPSKVNYRALYDRKTSMKRRVHERGKLQFVYALSRDVKIEKRFEFFKTVYDMVRSRYQIEAPKMNPKFRPAKAA